MLTCELSSRAGMAELADAADSKSADLRVLGVRLPLPAPEDSFCFERSRSVRSISEGASFPVENPSL